MNKQKSPIEKGMEYLRDEYPNTFDYNKTYVKKIEKALQIAVTSAREETARDLETARQCVYYLGTDFECTEQNCLNKLCMFNKNCIKSKNKKVD